MRSDTVRPLRKWRGLRTRLLTLIALLIWSSVGLSAREAWAQTDAASGRAWLGKKVLVLPATALMDDWPSPDGAGGSTIGRHANPFRIYTVAMANGPWVMLSDEPLGLSGWTSVDNLLLDGGSLAELDRPRVRLWGTPPDHVERGERQYAQGHYDEAISEFTAAIGIYPRDARAFCGRGDAWIAKLELDKAIADYDEAIRIDPNSAYAYYRSGCILT